MRICHILRFTPHGGLSPENLTSGTRGLTGSEQALIAFAEASAAAGHKVVIYAPMAKPFLHNEVWYKDSESAWPRFQETDGADAVVSWLSADPLKPLPESVFRVHILQINDWSLCTVFDTEYPHVDRFVVQSESHQRWLWTRLGHPASTDKVAVINNGVWTQRYPLNPRRIPHRLIACSSPDRGLHILLYLWPDIRTAVPDATLHIFYETKKWIESTAHMMNEMGQRARYIREKLEVLKGHGVHLHNAVPPMTLAQEISRSDFMVYPCFTITFTEGFSVSTMEGCAAGTVPIITDIDALGEVYGKSGAVVVPIHDKRTRWIDDYRDTLIQMLQHGVLLSEHLTLEDRRAKCRAFAQAYDYSIIGPKFNEMLEQGVAGKGNHEG